MKITLYYVICRSNPTAPFVAFVSKDYADVVEWRAKLNAAAGRSSSVCQEWHEISQREVTLH